MRRLAGLAVALLLSGCSAVAPSVPTSPTPTLSPVATASASDPTPAPTETAVAAPCTAEAAALSLSEQVGQLVMVGVGVDLTAAQRSAITKYHLGSAIVMGSTTTGGVAKVASLSARLTKLGGDTGMLVAADQEGGLVQRLQGEGFRTIPSAAQQARMGTEELTARARSWGKEMARAGVRLNLAPVADVVPAKYRSTNQPIARLGRGYGSDPEVVSAKVAAFSEGMEAAGVAVAVKHFPGLGAVTGNTDFATKVVDSTTTADSPLLQPFEDAVSGGASAVMVSSAYYTKLDAKRPAMFSPTVVGLLRDWGFEGVVVSDDVGAAAALSSVPVGERAVRFVRAGGDLALTVDASTAGPMAVGLRKAAAADPDLAARVTESAARVLALKASLGLTTCA
ncbi:MAG: glycoside hydrolase family 3 N-terminal domain-containing protein [Propionicimonas sp.]|uniref:glycoside hydrolase family 3 N-terminal domain-containing protein n=1 Tax=Propionicimonas sp. TaxID=1955623 RepID=UPI003D1259FF